MKHNDPIELENRLGAVGIKPAPHASRDRSDGYDESIMTSREVNMSTPDGVYFQFDDKGDDLQILVVGPMLRTPGEIAEQIHRGYWVKEVFFMDPASRVPAAAQVIRDRGFISIILRHQDDEACPSFDDIPQNSTLRAA